MTHYLLYYKKDDVIKNIKHDDVMDDLYELRATVPSEDNIKDYIKNGTNKEIIKYLKSDTVENVIDRIKKTVSSVNNKIPLYDAYKKNLFIVAKENVYDRVVYQSYRFPDVTLIDILKKKRKDIEPHVKKLSTKYNLKEDIQYDVIHKEISLQEEYHKLGLMLGFFESFDLETLENTYIKIFYYYANEVGKNITVCVRPSFMPYYIHLKPYYTRSELINLGLNMGIIKPNKTFYTKEKVMELCEKVSKNEITSDTIAKHQEHIIKNDKIGVIQYYSLQGSYFINKYLRNMADYSCKNPLLEDIIKSMWELVITAPSFDKPYTLYRFIHDDAYLKHLNIGDKFTDTGFISTTRDPFYRSEVYRFGFILIKINIPAKTRGVGLCIESYSHFPEEQEIVLPPLSILKLDKKDENALYYHTDDIFASKIATRYEFTYMSSEPVSFMDRPLLNSNNASNIVDFLNIKKSESTHPLTVYEKIKLFYNTFVNDIYQFKTKIGKNVMDIVVEWYDSTNAYKKFYGSITNNGFSFYTFKNNYMVFMIEIGEIDNEPYMYVNYYFKYASTNKEVGVCDINDGDFVEFLSKVAYYFGVKNVVLYAEYISCDVGHGKECNNLNDSKVYRGGNYCVDFYTYLKNGIKRFRNDEINIDTTELRPQFSYYELDRLKKISPVEILKKDDRDEIYQIYHKIYKLEYDNKNDNISDFFVWMVDNYCIFVSNLVSKMHRIYSTYSSSNPFVLDYYILDASRYLYNKGLIMELLMPVKNNFQNKDMPIRINKNEYRLQYYKRDRIPVIN